MDTKKLITPEFRVTVGMYELTNGIEAECFSSKEGHADWCRIELSNNLFQEVDFSDMDKAVLELGYDNDYDVLLSGYARKQTGDYWKEIIIKDDTIKLERTGIRAAFTECTPQDVLRYILNCADINDYVLSDKDYGKKGVLVIDTQNALDAIKDINAAWGIENDFFFQNNIFYWGTKQEQTEIYVLEEGENILALNRYGSLWEAEIIAVPWLHHSQEVEIVHRKFSGRTEIQKTIIRSEDAGVKMYVYFGGGQDG